MSDNHFSTQERLKNKKDIDTLFAEGTWCVAGNMRMVSYRAEDLEGYKISVSVSKRNFKKAVDRNRIKRLLRECYRLNKPVLNKNIPHGAYIMFFWWSKKMPTNYDAVLVEYLQLLEHFAKKNSKAKGENTTQDI